MRTLIIRSALLLLAVCLGTSTLAQSSSGNTTLSPEQAAQDVRVLKRVITTLHPGLTKYQSQQQWDAALAKFEASGNAARTPTQMFLAASELATAVRCGHTWTNVRNQSGAIKAALFESANKLPFTVTYVQGRWLVLASATPDVTKGDELLSINGANGQEIVRTLWPYVRADGASDSKRYRQLGHDRVDHSPLDIVWPLLNPPRDGFYDITAATANGIRTLRVKAVTLAERDAAYKAQSIAGIDETWTMKVQGEGAQAYAVMRLPTFVFWNSKFDWKAWLAEKFNELNQRKVPKLIIDIRDLEGGDGAIGGHIVSYLIKQPYQYTSDQAVTMYERVPYIMVRYLDTWDYDFFDRTSKVEKITEGPQTGKLLVKSRVMGTRTIQPQANPFQGKVMLLVSGENSSAGFQFAWLAQTSKAATLVGQPTGGNLRGLNGGELTWVTLPNTGVSVDIPLLATRYTQDTPDASVTPDVLVNRTFAGQKAGRDEEMAKALSLLK